MARGENTERYSAESPAYLQKKSTFMYSRIEDVFILIYQIV